MKIKRTDVLCSHCRSPLADDMAWGNEDSQYTGRQFCSAECAEDDYDNTTEHFAGFLDPAVPSPADFHPGYILPEDREE